jgi:hypothetical protein
LQAAVQEALNRALRLVLAVLAAVVGRALLAQSIPAGEAVAEIMARVLLAGKAWL